MKPTCTQPWLLALSAALLFGVSGCASNAAHKAAPAQAAASAPVEPQPILFRAKRLHDAGNLCAGAGRGLFAVPWEHSPQYDPLITFVQPPQPVATCVTMMGVVAVGAYAQVEKLGTLYQVVVQPAILKEQRSATF